MSFEVIAVCRSKKKMRPKAAAILDRYLFRIGDRTWKGRASTACLRRISNELKAIASRNLAVSVHRARSASTLEAPLFVVGSKSRFSPSGVVPISIRRSGHKRGERSNMDEIERALIVLSALMHDVGKCTNLFQDKLHRALEPAKKGRVISADPVRHEVFSAFFFDALCRGLDPTDTSGLGERLSSAIKDPKKFSSAAKIAEKKCLLLASKGGEGSSLEFEVPTTQPEHPIPGVLLLVLTHHRLFDTNANYSEIQAKYHATFGGDVDKKDFEIAPGREIWFEASWIDELTKIAKTLETSEKGALIRGDLYARTALMLADHVGSNEKEPSASMPPALANTTADANKKTCPADSVSKHTERVACAASASIRMMQSQLDIFPALNLESCPEAIRVPGPTTDRFAWQGIAARKAADLSRSSEGGFFGCLLAGTGTGKTRGAPTILANATFADAEPARRNLRFNLSLGLRTLAHQSASEYVDSLDFSSEDIAVLVGGETISWDDEPDLEGDAKIEQNGFEDRLACLAEVRAEAPASSLDTSNMASLGLDCDRHLPAFAERMAQASREGSKTLRHLLSAPIVVSTIDHLMPAADGRRSWHLPAMLRVGSSDLIIDELDQFSEEDIMAIERLAEIVGAFGRRLLVMSATLPRDVAEQMYDAYRRGYADYCRRTNREERIHVLVSGDAPGSQFGETDPDFSSLYKQAAKAICNHLLKAPPLRKASILPPINDWTELAEQVTTEIASQHYRNCSATDDGFQISAGIVRMTRVKHLQNLVRAMPEAPNDDVYREFVIVHSRMPQIQRSWIEHKLRKALTRKGDDPNGPLEALLRSQGVLARANASGKRHVALVVLSSPVIETGNDADFDYAIIDPSSPRAVIQTAGRVRRHRNPAPDGRNISILGEYCVSRLEKQKRYQMPGVETKPCQSVLEVSLDDQPSREAATLLGDWQDHPIDASLLLSESANSILVEKEAQLRLNFRQSDPSVANRVRPLARWSAKRALSLRFRRSSSGEATALPAFTGGGNLKWFEFTGRRNKTLSEVKIFQGESVCHLPVILASDLIELLATKNNPHTLAKLMPMGAVSFFPDADDPDYATHLDPVLGAMKMP